MLNILQIPKFETEMTARSADWQLIVYGNTDHSFTVPGQPLYRKQSADRAWNATVSFLAEAFAWLLTSFCTDIICWMFQSLVIYRHA